MTAFRINDIVTRNTQEIHNRSHPAGDLQVSEVSRDGRRLKFTDTDGEWHWAALYDVKIPHFQTGDLCTYNGKTTKVTETHYDRSGRVCAITIERGRTPVSKATRRKADPVARIEAGTRVALGTYETAALGVVEKVAGGLAYVKMDSDGLTKTYGTGSLHLSDVPAPKFYEGDLVRCCNATNLPTNPLERGRVYEVHAVDMRKALPLTLHDVTQSGSHLSLEESRFEKATTPRVGDWATYGDFDVKVLKNTSVLDRLVEYRDGVREVVSSDNLTCRTLLTLWPKQPAFVEGQVIRCIDDHLVSSVKEGRLYRVGSLDGCKEGFGRLEGTDAGPAVVYRLDRFSKARLRAGDWCRVQGFNVRDLAQLKQPHPLCRPARLQFTDDNGVTHDAIARHCKLVTTAEGEAFQAAREKDEDDRKQAAIDELAKREPTFKPGDIVRAKACVEHWAVVAGGKYEAKEAHKGPDGTVTYTLWNGRTAKLTGVKQDDLEPATWQPGDLAMCATKEGGFGPSFTVDSVYMVKSIRELKDSLQLGMAYDDNGSTNNGWSDRFFDHVLQGYKGPIVGPEPTTTPAKDETSDEGGTKHDSAKVDLSILPFDALSIVAQVLEFGGAKYERNNFRKGIDDIRLQSAALGHIMDDIRGLELDDESDLPHIAHAACSLLFMLALRYGDGFDTIVDASVRERFSSDAMKKLADRIDENS